MEGFCLRMAFGAKGDGIFGDVTALRHVISVGDVVSVEFRFRTFRGGSESTAAAGEGVASEHGVAKPLPDLLLPL
jgi:hypothetical protein